MRYTTTRFALVGTVALVIGLAGLGCSDKGDSPSSGTGGVGTGGTNNGSGGDGTGGNPEGTCQPFGHETVATWAVENVDSVAGEGIDALTFVEQASLAPRVLGMSTGERLEFREDAVEGQSDLVSYMSQRLFVTANVESEDAEHVVYNLSADLICLQGAPGGLGPENDGDEEDCREFLADHPVRLDVTRTGCEGGDHLRAAVLLGTDQTEVGFLEMTPTLFAVEATVEGGLDALERMGVLDDEEDLTFDANNGGTLRQELEIVSPGVARYSATMPTAMHYGHLDQGARAVVDVNGPGTLFSFEADSNAGTITGTVDVKETGLVMLLDDFAWEFFDTWVRLDADGTQTVEVSVPGYTTSFVYDTNQERLTATSIGLGDGQSVVSWQDHDILTVDVNPNGNREFDLVVTQNNAADLLLAMDPGFELVIDYNMDPVADQLDDMYEFALEDTLTISLSGTDPSVRLSQDGWGDIKLLWGEYEDSLLEVTSGTLTMTSTRYPDENITVTEGSCLLYTEAGGPHAFLSNLAAGTCE